MIDFDCVFAQDESFAFRQIAGETILVPIYGKAANLESIFTLDEVGASIWRLLDGRRTLHEVRDGILEEYDAGADEAGSDLLELVESLVAIGALKPV